MARTSTVLCPTCGWAGTPADHEETNDAVCPVCDEPLGTTP